MRYLLRTIILLLGLVTFAERAVADSHIYKLYVEGQSCPFCAYGLEDRLSKVIGVTGLRTNFREGVVVITTIAGFPLNEKAVLQAVNDAGFTPRKKRK